MARPTEPLTEDPEVLRRIEEERRAVAARAAAARDPYAGLAPIGRAVESAGAALGGALEGARQVPGVEGALTALGTVSDVAVRTPLGLAALGADRVLGTGLTAATRRRLAQGNRPIWEAPKFAHEELGGAFSKVASDPRQDALSRLAAQLARGAQVAGEFATPALPGLGAIRGAVRGATATRYSTPLGRVARADAAAPSSASRLVTRSTDIPPTGTTPRAPRVGPARPTLEPDPRDLGFRPQTFENLAPETRRLIHDEAAAQGGFRSQRRGVRTIRQIEDASNDVEVSTLRNVAPGTSLNAEEFRAVQKAVGRAASERRRLQDDIVRAGGPEHAPTELKLQLLRAAVDQAAMQRTLTGARTEAGRTMRIMREAIARADAEGPRAYDRALDVLGGRERADRFIGRLNDIWTRDVPDAVKAEDTYQFLRRMDEATVGDKLNEVFINSILSNPVTHEINTISNAVFALTQIPTRLAAATFDVGRAAVTRTPREVFFSEVGAEALGMLRGVPSGARKAMHIIRSGYTHEDVARWTETGLMGRTQAVGGKAGTFVNAPTRALSAMDALFKGIASEGELYAQAARIASKERLSGQAFARRVAELRANPTDAMVAAAEKKAKYVTFQSDPDTLTKLVLKGRNLAIPGVGLQPGRFLLPFISTPMNLAKRGLEYSPAGIVRAVTTRGAEQSTALARAAIGTSVLAFFVPKVMSGEVTAAAPEGRGERDEFYRQGKIPYALRVGDQWVEFRRLEPALTPLRWLAPLAELFQKWQKDGRQPDAAMIGPILGAVFDAAKNASYLEGIENVMNAMEDPERWGERLFARTAGGMVPYSGALRAVAQAQDPYIRDPRGLGENLAASLPGLSQNVPARLDAFGRDVLREPTKQGAGVLQPIKADTATTDPVEQEFARVRAAVPDLNALSFVGTLQRDGQSVTRDEQRQYQTGAGQATHDALAALFVSPQYGAAPDAGKAKMIEKAISAARDRARSQVKGELGIPDSRGSRYRTPLGPGETRLPAAPTQAPSRYRTALDPSR